MVCYDAAGMSYFDIAYSVIGLLVAVGVWARFDAVTAIQAGVLMFLCYMAGGQKFRHR